MFKSAVIRDFCRIAKTALFALGVLFVSNSNAFACASGQVDVDGTCYNGKFAVKVDSQNHSKLTFLISASGTFTVNCGTDGTLTSNANDVTNNNYIDRRNNTNYTEYACSWPYYDGTYGATSAHVVTFDGSVDKYNSGAPAIGFYYGNPADYIKAIYGSLGAIFKTLNDGSNDQSKQPSFQNTFYGCTGLKSLPAELFDGVKGATEGMFSNTFDSCTGLTSLPTDSNGNSTLFKDIVGAAESMFNATFYGCTGLTSLPSGLFNVGNGAAERMFRATFNNCTGLTSLPTDSNGNSTLFNGINGAAKEMFGSTFSGCSGLTSLPTDSNGNSTLFNGINGAAEGMFGSTFSGCTGLTSLPKELFKGVNGGAESMFAFTFNNCTGLTSLPTDLFDGVDVAAKTMFNATFNNCTGLTSLPMDSNGNSTLFNGINGAAEGMFTQTFSYCRGLTSLPKELFKDITGANKLFYETFKGCTGLTSLPTDLFSDVNSAKANMFRATFNNCTGLTSLPTDSNGNSTLFNGINGAADVMFKETFSNCTGLTSLPSGLFNIGNDAAKYMFDATFQGCTGLTSLPTDSNGNSTLFNGINGTALFMFNETFSGCSGLTAIPYDLFDGASGTPDDASGMFDSTFYNATNLGAFDFGNGKTKDYVPGDFLSGITSDDTTSEEWYFATNMFAGTDLKSPCPAGTTDVTRNIFSDAGKPWCEASETYTITYNLKGGSGCSDETYSGTTTLCTPTYTGHTFNGWATTDGGAVAYAANASVTDTDLTLYAKWSPNVYYIEYNLDGGTAGGSYVKSKHYDISLSVLNPTRTGYTFTGWKITGMDPDVTHYYSTDNSSWTAFGDNTSTATVDPSYIYFKRLRATVGIVTFTAQWEPNTYNVTYDKHKPSGASSDVTGTTANSTHTYDVSKTLTPNGYSLTGWTFKGWSTNSACTTSNCVTYTDGQSVINLTSVNGDTVTLYAVWEPNTYKLIFTKTDDMIWDGNNEYQVTYGAALPTISQTPPTRPGYTFTGWYDSTTGGTQYYGRSCGRTLGSYRNTSDTTLYAQWEPNTYEITFDANGGSVGVVSLLYAEYNKSDLYTSYGRTATPPSATKTGYTFTGWYTAETGGSQVYNASGNLQRNVTGYTSDEDEPKWITTEDRTLYAQWTANMYEINFSPLNAGELNGTSPLYVKYNDSGLYTSSGEPATVPTATRTGYTYNQGWYTAASGGSQVYDTNGNLQRNVTGYTSDEDEPKWITTQNRTLRSPATPNTYTVTLDVATNGGSGGMGIIKEIYNTKWTDSDGNTITSVTIPTHPTGVFYGYYDSDNKQKISANGNIKYGSADITSDQTWYAKFGTCACTIDSINHVASCESITSDDQNRCKYRYTCADYYNTNGEQSGTFYGAENTQTNNAPTCDPNEYIITLDNANATTNGTSILYTKYYTGVYLDAERTQALNSTNKITIPERSGYITVSYDTNGGSLSSNLTDANTKANYVFDGYYSDVIGGTQYIDTTGIGTSDGRRAGYSYTTNDNVWHAQWKADNVTTPWVIRDGYTFAGWYDAQNGGNCVARCVIGTASSRYTPTADITLYAQWTPKTYKVTLNHNGADTSANVSEFWYRYNESDSPCTYYTADASVEANRISENCVSTPITIPTKTGYTFNGYSYYIDASGNISDNLYKTIDDKTLYARWTINTYTINFDLDCRNDGWADRSATYGSSFTVSNPVCSGYTFAGWDITGMDTVEHTYGNSTTNETSISGTTATTFKNLRSTPGTVKFKAKWISEDYTITYKTSFYGDVIPGLTPIGYSTGDTLDLPTNVNVPYHVFSGVWYDGDNEITQITPEMSGDKVLIAKWSSITCPAGYYLQGNTNTCKECISGDYYCPGDTFTPDGEDHGQEQCPTPTNVKEKAYGLSGMHTVPGLAGFNKDLDGNDKYLNDTVEDCVAGLIYGDESIINHDSGIAGSKYDEPKYSYYDRTLPANTNNTVSIQLCAYDPTKGAYTKCFHPMTQVSSDMMPLIYCSQGYYIEQTYVTEGAELVEQINACGENNTCKENEIINWIKENIIGDPYACKKGEPGYYTATYDALVDSTGIDEYVLESGALSVWGVLVNPEKLANWTGEEDFTTTDVSDTYKSCSVETDGAYVHSNAASWTKTQCYSTVTFVYDNGNPNTTTSPIYYSESAPNGYTLSSLPQPTKTNFVFAGWYDSDDNRVTTSTVLKGDQTLYAHWTQDAYSITLNKNGGSGTIRDNTGTTYTGSGNGSMTCAAGSTAALPTWLEDASSNNTTNISKGFGENAKIFLGWSTDPNATSGVFSASCSADGVTYYAIWSTPDCNAINGNATVSNVTENKPVCEISCDCGYETSGTYTGTAGSTEYTYTCTASTIELNYENGGHGTAPARDSCVYGETFTMPAAMTEPGYTFEKWITSGSTTTEFDAGQTSVECSTATLGNDVCDGSATITGSWTLSTGNCSSTEIEYMGNCYPRVFWMDLNIPDGDKEFEFMISAAGTFYVDCGEGGTLSSQSNDVDTEFKTRIYRPDYVGKRIYTCSYSTGGTKTINFAGEAQGYYSTSVIAAISFNHISYTSGTLSQDTNIKKIIGIYGSLGSIFKSIANPENNTWASEPAFYATFVYGTNIEGTIPNDIFSGVTGTAPYMFYGTFRECSGLTGPVPDFSQISGPGQRDMFYATFAECSGLTGEIPSNNFLGINSAAPDMFSQTFVGCSKLTGDIPSFENIVFNGADGENAQSMFNMTFSGCSGLNGTIPADTFAGIKSTAPYMFYGTFRECSGLTGPVPDFSQIQGPGQLWMFKSTFAGCSGLDGQIPPRSFLGINSAAPDMFYGTFSGCSKLTGDIPSFENIVFNGTGGENAVYMFRYTFEFCSGLDGKIPRDAFEGIKSTAPGMFQATFSGCSKLKKMPDTDGVDHEYIDASFLADIYDDGTDYTTDNVMTSMFDGTGFDNPCPANTYEVKPEFGAAANKPWCSPCPGNYTSEPNSQNINQCYRVCPETDANGAGTLVSDLSGYAYYAGEGVSDDISQCKYRYNIIYMDGNEELDDDDITPKTYVAGVGAEINYIPTKKTGHTFAGWFTDNSTFTNQITQIDATLTGDITLYAKWTPDTYIVTYEPGVGGSGSMPNSTATYYETFVPDAPSNDTITKEHATFTGWAVSDTNDTREANTGFRWEYAENKTFTATWVCNPEYILNEDTGACDPKTVALRYIDSLDNSIIETEPQMCTYGENFNLPPAPTKPGFVFAGWEIIE